jgi:hypothetical protein
VRSRSTEPVVGPHSPATTATTEDAIGEKRCEGDDRPRVRTPGTDHDDKDHDDKDLDGQSAMDDKELSQGWVIRWRVGSAWSTWSVVWVSP